MTALDNAISAQQQRDSTIEIIKFKLRRYRSLVNQYNACKELRDNLFPRSTPVYSDMPKGGGTQTEMERVLDKRWALMEQMDANLQAQQDEINEAIGLLEGLALDEYTVLMRRYMLGESMEAIACQLNYSVRWCWKQHNRGIRAIAKREESYE